MITPLGIGAIAHDTEPGAHMAEIVIYDLVNGDEELPKTKSDTPDMVNKSADAIGNIMFSSAQLSNTILARYANGGSSLVTMPNLKQGEQVEVYQIGGSDRYYFKPFNLDKALRRKEIKVFAFSNKDEDSEFGEHFDKDSSYTFTVDTVNKLLEIKTSVSDKEPVLYTISLDTKKAELTIEDSEKNVIKLESLKKTLTVTVPNLIYNSETVKINASKSFTIDTPKYKLGGGKATVDSSVQFNKSCDHKESVKFNGKSKTVIGKGPKPHIHPLD